MKNIKSLVACISACAFAVIVTFVLLNSSYAEKSRVAHEPGEHVNEPADHDHQRHPCQDKNSHQPDLLSPIHHIDLPWPLVVLDIASTT